MYSYSQKQIYDVVANVSEYKEFLPYCFASDVLETQEITEGSQDVKTMKAALGIGFPLMKMRYTSHVTCRPYDSVHVRTSVRRT